MNCLGAMTVRLQARAAQVALRGIEGMLAVSRIPPEQRTTAAFYLLVTTCNVPAALAAEAAGCTRQNVSKSLGRVEDRREGDMIFGAEIDAIERQLLGEA